MHRPRIRYFLVVGGLFAALTGACKSSGPVAVRPKPPAARAVVKKAVVVQLRLASESIERIYPGLPLEQHLLAALVHAWAALYSLEDPTKTDLAALYAFTDELCRRRFPRWEGPRDLTGCADLLRRAMYEDLIDVVRRYRRGGHPDVVGNKYRLSVLERDFRRRLARVVKLLPQLKKRRAKRTLALVDRCDVAQPDAPELGIWTHGVELDGLPLIALEGGGTLADLTAGERRITRRRLERRLLEGRALGSATDQLIVAVDKRVTGGAVGVLLQVARQAGVNRVCLKARRRGAFIVPCCLNADLLPEVLRPPRWLDVGVERVTVKAVGGDGSALPPARHATFAARLHALIAQHGGRLPPLLLRKVVPMGRVADWLSAATGAAPSRPLPQGTKVGATGAPAPPRFSLLVAGDVAPEPARGGASKAAPDGRGAPPRGDPKRRQSAPAAAMRPVVAPGVRPRPRAIAPRPTAPRPAGSAR